MVDNSLEFSPIIPGHKYPPIPPVYPRNQPGYPPIQPDNNYNQNQG